MWGKRAPGAGSAGDNAKRAGAACTLMPGLVCAQVCP